MFEVQLFSQTGVCFLVTWPSIEPANMAYIVFPQGSFFMSFCLSDFNSFILLSA